MAQPMEMVTATTEPGLSQAEGWWSHNYWIPRIFYWGLHAACVLGLWIQPTPGDAVLLAATFGVRMFAVTGGYHRYFAHKSYKTSRPFQFVLAVLGVSATQKGPLWWAGNHRIHHKYSDEPGDVHSPREGFWHSHVGWIFDGRWDATPTDRIADFARYPELVWLNRWHIVGPAAVAVACFAIGGGSGLLWGFVVSTVLLWHTTYSINSVAHRIGTRRFDTPDDSRNNWLLGLLTMGEGWHNNHHRFCASTRQGFRWWEIDLTYYALRGLAALGLVWDLREPPAHLLGRGEAPVSVAPRKA